jgi:hypothetical protein
MRVDVNEPTNLETAKAMWAQQRSGVALAPWRWTNDGQLNESERPLFVLSLGATPWVLQYSQLASCQSGSITFPFLSQA